MEPINHDYETCIADDGEIFSAACNMDIDNSNADKYDAICYHGPIADRKVIEFFLES